MDEEDDHRLAAIAPDISRTAVDLLRSVVGAMPEWRIPQRALAIADDVLEEYGTDGLRALVMSLTGWAAVHIEKDAKLTGRTLEAVVDDIALVCIEAHADHLTDDGPED